MQKKISKRYRLEALTATLRQARHDKGLSQRALGQAASFPQAQISRIENGEVDLQLSTLIELARTLDLEVQLVPRRALPAVSATIKETNERSDERNVRSVLKELQDLSRQLRPSLAPDQADGLESAIRELTDVAALIPSRPLPNPVREAQSIMRSLAQGGSQISGQYRGKAIEALIGPLRDLHNSLVHARTEDEPRPAYGMNDEADDGHAG